MTLNDSAPGPDVSPVLPTPGPTHHHGAAYRLRTYFLTGLIVAGPLAITVYLTWSFVTWSTVSESEMPC